MIFAILCCQLMINCIEVEHACEQFDVILMKKKAIILVPKNLHLDSVVMSYNDKSVARV